MREALAATDYDFVMAEPKTKKPAAKGSRAKKSAGQAKKGPASSRMKRYAGFAAGTLSVAAIAGILVNALVLQKSRHPAPLFSHAASVKRANGDNAAPTHSSSAPAHTTASSASQSAPVSVPVPPPAERAMLDKLAAGESPPSISSSAPAPNKAKDEIAQFLLGGSQEARKTASAQTARLESAAIHPSSHHAGASKPETVKQEAVKTSHGNKQEPADHEKQQPSKTIFAAQKALVKLGFVLKPDGLPGASTKQAIAQFEQDHKLPAQGTLTPKILHMLEAETGIKVQ